MQGSRPQVVNEKWKLGMHPHYGSVGFDLGFSYPNIANIFLNKWASFWDTDNLLEVVSHFKGLFPALLGRFRMIFRLWGKFYPTIETIPFLCNLLIPHIFSRFYIFLFHSTWWKYKLFLALFKLQWLFQLFFSVGSFPSLWQFLYMQTLISTHMETLGGQSACHQGSLCVAFSCVHSSLPYCSLLLPYES